MSKIKTASEILESHIKDYMSEKGIIEAMKEYASQFIDRAAEEAHVSIDSTASYWKIMTDHIMDNKIKVNKESILKVKQLIK